MRGKIPIKKTRGQRIIIKVKCASIIFTLLLSANIPRAIVSAVDCPSLRIVFARGSGGTRWEDPNYLAFKSTLENKLETTSIDYEFIDLDYPAVGVGLDNLEVSLGALIGSGDAYEFGASINTGVKNLANLINNTCPNTKYVIGGYSQGAMVISKSLSELNPNRLIYAATFGDPKIYLPEGKGIIPPACKNEKLSDYRMYVPDCQAYKGLLGAYKPYEPKNLLGKVGVWCNKSDIFCSSHLNISDHLEYISDNLYEDASRVLFDKICQAFNIKNNISSPHDTAILIDSTESMERMINKYKSEALRLATETFSKGGRVALYDYRDLSDPYQPIEHCNFETCTPELFESELSSITTDGGGDGPESLLSASLHVMKTLKWKYGSTKSLIVLTDAGYLSPDRDGTMFEHAVKWSKRIDPVNFYIITNSAHGNDYETLASATNGQVITNFDELSMLTDYIIERYDSLPRVEETENTRGLPSLTINSVNDENGNITIKFSSTGIRTMVVLNDAILGITNENEITLINLDWSLPNNLTLVPLGNDIRGEPVKLSLDGLGSITVPKAPNTGKH